MTRKTTVATLITISMLTLAILLSGSCGGNGDNKATVQESSARSVIILAIDGLRADALGCYGGAATTPALRACGQK